VNVLENYHMISVDDMIASYVADMISANPNLLTFEKDDLIMSCSQWNPVSPKHILQCFTFVMAT